MRARIVGILGAVASAWVGAADCPGYVIGYSHGLSTTGSALTGGGDLKAGVTYNLAYVYDGSEERLYVNGGQVASRPASGSIGVGGSTIGVVGATFRDNALSPSFIGGLRSLRVSGVSRYGAPYAPNLGNFADDDSTLLLYNFDSVPAGATSIPDLSGNGHTGTPGVGFTGATLPDFGTTFATFADHSDTISIAGNVSATAAATYEAVLTLEPGTYVNGSFGGSGMIWNMWQGSVQDEALAVGGTVVPESGTLASLALGGLALLSRRLRRGRN
jgi:hypothetical protein